MASTARSSVTESIFIGVLVRFSRNARQKRPPGWGVGPSGPLAAEFYAVRVRTTTGRGERWLLRERSGETEHKFYLLNLQATATRTELVALARSRWPIEQQCFVLTAVAFTFLQLERGRPTTSARPTLPVVRSWVREIFGLLYIHSRRVLGILASFKRKPPLRKRQSSVRGE